MESRWWMLSAGLVLCTWWGSGLAAETPVDLDELVITPAKRETLLRDTADVVQVIDRREIEALHPTTTGELLEYATGIATETGTGSGLPKRSVVSLNGLPSNYTLVLVDGVRLLSDHMHTGQNLELIPPSSIERIEVVRGSGSAMYGADAIGGVVNIITRRPGDKPEARLRASVADYDTYQGGASLLLPLGQGVRLASFIDWEDSEGIPLKAPAHRVGKTGYRRLNLLNRLDARLGEMTRVYAWLNWVDMSMDWQEGTADSYMLMPVVGIEQSLSPTLDVMAQVAYSTWHAEVSSEDNSLLQPETRLTWRCTEHHTLSGGVDFRYNDFTRTAVLGRTQRAYGVYVQDEWVPLELVSLTAALRYDKVEDINSAVSPKLAVLLSPADNVRVRASVGRGFHAPTLQELYEEGYGHGGRAYRFGNPELEPETSTTYTGGIEYQPVDSLELMAHVFYSDIDDMIVPVYAGVWDKDPTKDVWRRTNISQAEVYGAEAAARVRIGEHLRLEGGYTWSDNEDKNTGQQLPYRPGASAYGKLLASHRVGGRVVVSGFVGVRTAYDREAWNWQPADGAATGNPDGLTTPLRDYTKLDAGVTCTFNDAVDVYVRVQNILGEDIENLDDSYTVIDGEPIVQVGVAYNLPLAK